MKALFSDKVMHQRNHKYKKTLTNFKNVSNISNKYFCKTTKDIPIPNHPSVLKCLPQVTMDEVGTRKNKFKNLTSVKLLTDIFSHAKETF